MVKKRLIFTLLYCDGYFMLSRNFRLQKVGDIQWIERNYNLPSIAQSLDELVVLNVSRGERDFEEFGEVIKRLIDFCFIPVAAGGGVTSLPQAEMLFRSGADKLVINTAINDKPEFVRELSAIFGAQSLIASLDCKTTDAGNEAQYRVYVENGQRVVPLNFEKYVEKTCDLGVGEIYLNSMDKDGTGQGYDTELLVRTREIVGARRLPIIMAGGAGNCTHFEEVIDCPNVDGVATANLFNFIGAALPNARGRLLERGAPLAVW